MSSIPLTNTYKWHQKFKSIHSHEHNGIMRMRTVAHIEFINSNVRSISLRRRLVLGDFVAIYHVHHGFVSRSTGRSSVQSAAYICGEKLYEERREKIADFSKKAEEVAVTNTLFPENSKYRDTSVWNEIIEFLKNLEQIIRNL